MIPGRCYACSGPITAHRKWCVWKPIPDPDPDEHNDGRSVEDVTDDLRWLARGGGDEA